MQLWIGFGLAAGVSCTKPNPLYCDDKIACQAGQVCVLPEHECRPVDGGDGGMVDLQSPDLSGVQDLAMDDMSTGPTCKNDTECMGRDPKKPACLQGRCVACVRNYHCANSACDEGNVCHDPAKILVVDDDAATCRRLGGPADKPYCYLADALRDTSLGMSRDLILVRPSTKLMGHFLDGNFLQPSKSVRIVGARTSQADQLPVLREPFKLSTAIGVNLTVSLEDVQLANFDSGDVSAIYCERLPVHGAINVSLAWAKVTGAPLYGVYSDGCSLRSVSSVYTGNGAKNPGGGIFVNGGSATLYNNVIASNGQNGTMGAGLRLAAVASVSAQIAFNTITNNACSVGSGLGCNVACGLLGNIPITYSIVTGVRNGMELSGNCAIDNSLVPAGYLMGMGNLKNITPAYVAAATGDFHLLPNDPVNRMLRKSEMNPVIAYDIDGDSRTGGAVDIGADQIP